MPAQEEQIDLRSPLALLRSARFGPYLACGFLSNVGTWMQLVAEPWLLLQMSGSSFLVGLDSFMMNGPILLLTFLGGSLADQRDRRGVILFFQSIQMACPLAVIALILTGTLTPWIIIALSLVVGITDALSMPAFQSITPLIVKREEIGQASALNATSFNLARVVGPALGGWLMARYGALTCFGANAISYIPFIAAAYLALPAKIPAAAPAETPDNAGFKTYFELLKHPGTRGALYAVLIMSFFCGPVLGFSSVIVSSILHGDASEFGNSMAAFGIGGLAGAGLLLFAGTSTDTKKLCAGAAILYGLTLVVISFVTTPLALKLLMGCAGALMAAASATANAALQSAAQQQNFGRAAGLYMLFLRGGLALGNLWAGFFATKFGITWFLLLSGALGAGLQILNYLRW